MDSKKYIGMDVHKESISITVMNSAGKLVMESVIETKAGMSRPANPYDNASCESFMKTLKGKEIYANRYGDLGHMRGNIEEFIERYLTGL